jgi:hypothetical protein
MTAVAIDRLSLKLSGLSAGEGDRLARLIADGLARQQLTSSAQSVESMTINISSSGGNLQRLSEQIVREIMRQL